MNCYTSQAPLFSDPGLEVTELLPCVLSPGTPEAQEVRLCQNQLASWKNSSFCPLRVLVSFLEERC